MTVASVTILSPPDGFDAYGVRPGIDVVWTGGVGPFDVRYEWDDNTGFASPITVTNVGVTSPDSAVPTSDMGPADWYFRVTVIDNDDSGEVQEPIGSYRTLEFQDADDNSRYLYVTHNIGVGFGVDDFDDLPLGDGKPDTFNRYLYLNANVTTDQPCPWLDFITPTLQIQGGTVTLIGNSFGATQGTYSGQVRLYESASFGAASVLMSPTSWSDTEVSVTVPSGATTGFVALIHTVGATCDGSAFKMLTVVESESDPDMGWWVQTADKENAITADATILPNNVMSASFKKIMNAIGSGVIEIPLSEPDIDSIIDPLLRKGVLLRCYIDDRFRYAFFGEKLTHAIADDGQAVARITGRGMEAVAVWTKILPHDAPASPSRSPTWVYGSTENLIRNGRFSDVVDNPILVNAGGEDGNIDNEDGNTAGVAIGWEGTGDGLTYFRAVKDSLAARTGDWFIKVATSATRSGMSQAFTVTPNHVYHVWGYVKEPTAAGQRVLLSLGGADDITAFNSSYPNNFKDEGRIYAELDNAVEGAGASDGTYQRLDVEVTTGAEQTSIDVAFENFDTSIFVPFYVEDVEPVGWGLGLEPWVVYDAPVHAVDSFSFSPTQTRDGATYSLYIDILDHDPNVSGPGFQTEKMTVTPSTKYTLTSWIYPTGTPDDWALAIVADDNILIRDFTALTPVADEWNEMQLIYTTAEDETEIYVRMTYEGETITDPSGAFHATFTLTPGEEAAFAGKIVNDVLDAMATAGKLTYLNRNFTDTLDSAGVPFPAKLSLDIEPSESLYGLLQRLVALGHEWEIVPNNFLAGGDTGFELNLFTARSFNPQTGIGVSQIDDDEGTVITPGDGIHTGRIIKTAFNVNTVFGLGQSGVWSQAEQFPYETADIPAGDPAPAGYKDSFGIIEDVVIVTGTDSETVAESAAGRLAEEKGKERSIKIEMQRVADIRPFLNFAVGDSLYVDLPPHNPDPLDSSGDRAYPKRVRSIKAVLPSDGVIKYTVDIDRVIHEDELEWRALIAQLIERAPADNVSQGYGAVSVSTVTAPTPTPTPTVHRHDLGSSDVTNKALSGDVSGTLPGPVTVNKVKGRLVSGTIPSITRALDPHRVAWVFDRDLAQWTPTELTDRDEGFFNGTFLESQTVAVTEAAGTVTMSLEGPGSTDLTMRFSDGHTTLDTTPALTIALTTGSDVAPTPNWIYILQSTKVLTKDTSDWPTEEHIKVAFFFVPSATFVAANGVVIHQNWTDHSFGSDDQGHMSHIVEHIRHSPAVWHKGLLGAGVDDYLTIAGTTVDLKIASGIVYQLHEHTIPAFDTSAGDVVLVKNWFGDAYHDITNLYDIVDDSLGDSIPNNRYFNFVVWGVANLSGTYSPTIINLSAGTYTSQAAAEADLTGFDDFTMPRQFIQDSSTGFLIARLTVQKKASTWEYKSTTNLRGFTSQSASGGAAGVTTTFLDNQIKVVNVDDVTKILELDVSGVTTATTRTLVVPDADGTIALVGGGGGSPLTTKGDLYGYDSADERIPIGTDSYVLTADSAQALGLKWAAAGGGVSVPSWMQHLSDRTVGGESVHGDDEEFTDSLSGTAVTPTGTAVWTQERGLLSGVFDNNSSTDLCPRLYSLTPSSPVTIEIAMQIHANLFSFPMFGVAFTDGTSTGSNIVGACYYVNTSGLESTIQLRHGTVTNINSSSGGSLHTTGASAVARIYLRVIWSAANTFKTQYSLDGVSWLPFGGSASKTMTPTHFGAFGSAYGSDEPVLGSFEYLRVTESDLSV